jgi:hypothetical protein
VKAVGYEGDYKVRLSFVDIIINLFSGLTD